jgi:hypothetical protein
LALLTVRRQLAVAEQRWQVLVQLAAGVPLLGLWVVEFAAAELEFGLELGPESVQLVEDLVFDWDPLFVPIQLIFYYDIS